MIKQEIICGVDESGRGPLAGPVFAAAVVFKRGRIVKGITDSKKLTPSTREQLYKEICDRADGFSIDSVQVDEIDQINILQASLKAMRKAILQVKARYTLVLVDGQYPSQHSDKG